MKSASSLRLSRMALKVIVSIILSHLTLGIGSTSSESFLSAHQSAERRVSDIGSTYYLFTIPSFKARLDLDGSLNSMSLAEIASNVDVVTSDYLFDYIEKYLIKRGDSTVVGGGGALHSVTIDVTVHELMYDVGSNERHLKVDIDGHATFRQIKIVSSKGSSEDEYVINQDKFADMVKSAFLGDTLMQKYQTAVQRNLPKVIISPLETNIPNQQLLDGEDEFHTHTSYNKGDPVLTVLFSLTLLLLVGAFYVFFSHEYRNRRDLKFAEDNNILLSDVETYSENSDEESIENGNSVAPKEIIPVPARDDEICLGISKRKQDLVKAIAPRRYVQTASPFDILYGAAFSHNDQEKVEKAHCIRSTSKTRSSKKFSCNKFKPLRPMLPISEGKEEEKQSLTGECRVPSKTSYSFPQFLPSIPNFLSRDNVNEEKSKANNVLVFRDFPRHDGTPCVMFTPKDELDWNCEQKKSKAASLVSQGKEGDDSFSHSSHSSSVNSSMAAGIDNFVDKLERLFAVRSRQYQERVNMDKERLERQSDLKQKRFEEKESHTKDVEAKSKIIEITQCLSNCENDSADDKPPDTPKIERILSSCEKHTTDEYPPETPKMERIQSYCEYDSADEKFVETPKIERIPLSEISLNLKQVNLLDKKNDIYDVDEKQSGAEESNKINEVHIGDDINVLDTKAIDLMGGTA